MSKLPGLWSGRDPPGQDRKLDELGGLDPQAIVKPATIEFHIAAQPTPSFFSQIGMFALSLRELGPPYSGAPIHVSLGHAERIPIPAAYGLERCRDQLRWHWVTGEEFATNPYAQSENRWRVIGDCEFVCMADADTLWVRPIDELLQELREKPAVGGVVVHYPQFAVTEERNVRQGWEYAAEMLLGQKIAFSCRHTLQTKDAPDNETPFCPNFGFVIGPRALMRSLSQDVYDLARKIINLFPVPPNSTPPQMHHYSAQIGLALAIAKNQTPWRELPMRYNWPNDGTADALYPGEIPQIRILHYLRRELFERHRVFCERESFARFMQERFAEAGNQLLQERVQKLTQGVFLGPSLQIPRSTMKLPLVIPDELHRNAPDVHAYGPENTGAALMQLVADRLGLKDLSRTSVLDIGCGVRFTQAILNRDIPIKSYTGVDVHRPLIEYLQREVTDSRFRFAYWNVRNAMYNPDGVQISSEARLPAEVEGVFDIIWLFSVFTHLNAADANAMLAILRTYAHSDSALFFSAFVDNTVSSFEERVPEHPLSFPCYTEHYLRELIEANGWNVVSVRPPEPFIQHYFICRPARLKSASVSRATFRPDLSTRPIIITGMHRSGTSVTASYLVDLGIHLGDRLLPSDRTNPRGFFEDIDFVKLHGRMLEAATPEGDGGHRDWGWTESEPLDARRFADYAPAAQELVAARSGLSGAWGWKDPRTTVLLDFWDRILNAEACYILLYRFPWEVADSMQRLGAAVFLENPEYALRIWSFYNRRLLDFYREHSGRAILVSFNALQRNPGAFVALLQDKLRLPVGEAAFEKVWQNKLFASFEPNDPLIRLTLATSPECGRLLEELDAGADLPSTGLWSRAPLRGEHLRPPEPVDLSVVIPCYNQGEFLVDAIASVERTAPERCELVIVNDGSNQPRTLEVLDILKEAGYCIIDQRNLGLAAARNNGIRAARGRYVLPLDADNRLLPGFLASAIEVLNAEPEIGVVYGDRVEFGARSGPCHVQGFDLNSLLQSNFIDACAVYRREIWEDCDGYDAGAAVLEDWEFWVATAKRGWRFYRLPDVTFEYRVRPNSMLAEATADQHTSSRDYIVRKHHELYRDVIPMHKLSSEEISRITLDVSTAPQVVGRSALFSLEARVTNGTDKTLYSVAPSPVRLAYHWIEKTTRKTVVFDGNRSGLIPGLPRKATGNYAMAIIAPSHPGEYILQATMVQEGIRWFEDVQPGIVQEFAVAVIA